MVNRSAAEVTLTITATMALGAAAITGLTAVRVTRAEARQRRGEQVSTHADILLVLGAQVTTQGPSKELRARLDHAIRRWYEGAAPLVGVTGGISGELDEAEGMANYVTAHGVPPGNVEQIVPGENSRASMRALAAAYPGVTVLAVSSPYHAHRLIAEGRRHGLTVIADCPARTPETSNPTIRRTRLMGETLGCMVYASPDWVLTATRRVVVPLRHQLTESIASASRHLRT